MPNDVNPFSWDITRQPAFLRSLRIPQYYLRDALQEAYLKLRGRQATRELLVATARNCYKDQMKADHRRRDRERQRGYIRAPLDDAASNSNCSPRRGDTHLSCYAEWDTNDPSANMQRDEIRRAIVHAVRAAKLSKDHLCALRVWLRGRVVEFAKRRKVAPTTVRVWIHRALTRLKPYMERAGLGPD